MLQKHSGIKKLGHLRRKKTNQNINQFIFAFTQSIQNWGQGGTMTPGPMGFRGPIRRPRGFIKPIEITLTNQFVEDRRPFFFGDHIKIRGKECHFSLLFWSTQNQRRLIFELTIPGPRLALGAHVFTQ